MRNFEEWINQFKFSISGYDYYVDFKKVYHQFPRFTQHNLSYLPADLGKLRMHQHFLAV